MCANFNLSANLKNMGYRNSFASGTPSKSTSKRDRYYVLLLSLSAVSQVDGFLRRGYFRLRRIRACVYITRIRNAILMHALKKHVSLLRRKRTDISRRCACRKIPLRVLFIYFLAFSSVSSGRSVQSRCRVGESTTGGTQDAKRFYNRYPRVRYETPRKQDGDGTLKFNFFLYARNAYVTCVLLPANKCHLSDRRPGKNASNSTIFVWFHYNDQSLPCTPSLHK